MMCDKVGGITLFFIPDDVCEIDSPICQICLESILGGAWPLTHNPISVSKKLLNSTIN
jgi:hypothetical protein